VLLSMLALAIAPGALLLLFFYLRDKYRKEPWFPLAVSLLMGAIAVVPSALCSVMLQRWTGWRPDIQGLARLLAGSLLIVGLVEESWKFMVVRLYAYRTREFDEPYDGIMYSAVVALGFATLENVYYVLSRGAGTGLLRAVLAVPGHALYGVLMGYFVGAAKFERTRARTFLLSLAGLGAAVLAHGVYDFIVFAAARRPLLLLTLPVFMLLAWVVILKATKQRAEQSPYRHPALAELERTGVGRRRPPYV
jgi:RsiW-degrading membrane proteinase PrsW (M82 family)